jgi:hypothetical protein
MLVAMKRPTFEHEIRNSASNLQTRSEWFTKWKGPDLGFTKNCIFIDEAVFRFNLRHNWARSDIAFPLFIPYLQICM